MSSPDRDPAHLWDMLAAAETIVRFIHGKTLQDYRADELLRSAVERQIEIIGEAARRVSTDFRSAHVEIPWRGSSLNEMFSLTTTGRSIRRKSGSW